MAKCEQCGREYEAERATSKFCSSVCKQASYRNKTVRVTKSDDVTLSSLDLELCRACKVRLPALENPRKHSGMCINCVTQKYSLKQPRVSQEAT